MKTGIKTPPQTTEKHVKKSAPAGTADDANRAACALYRTLILLAAQRGAATRRKREPYFYAVSGCLTHRARSQFNDALQHVGRTKANAPLERWLLSHVQPRLIYVGIELQDAALAQHGKDWAALFDVL